MAFTFTEVTPGTASGTKAIRDVVFCDATHVVAVGDTGLVYTSSDAGISFAAVTPPEANFWRGCAYAPPSSGLGTGSGRLCAVSSGGTNRTMYSDDYGATWHAVAAASVASWQSIVYDPVQKWFVAAASSSGAGVSRVMTGTGAAWTSRTAAAVKSWTFLGTDGVGNVVAAHVSGGTDCVMLSADSGQTWVSQVTPNWSTVGGPSSGNSGVAWLPSASKFAMSVRRSSDSKYRIATSPTGSTWMENDITDNANRPGCIIAAPTPNLFIFFDQAGTNRYNYSSDNGATWADADEGFHRFWDCGQWGESAGVVLVWNQNTNGTFLRGVWSLPPAITAINPRKGTWAGGTLVIVTGTNLTPANVVKIDGVPLVGQVFVDSTRIVGRVPAHGTRERKVVNVTLA